MMKNKLKSYLILVAMAGIIGSLVIANIPSVWAGDGNPNPRVMPPHAYPFGKSYGDWSAQWWKWQLKLPASDHPAFSLDGANCDAGQDGKVWFLTGAFTTEVPNNEFNTIVRELCHVPTGKAIFFPIINIECSTIEGEPFQLIEEGPNANIETCATSWIDGTNAVVEDLSVEIDGKNLENLEYYRFQSPVFEFHFEDPSDNILGVDCNSVECEDPKPRSVSDGFWIMLPPLSKGEHTVRFTGSFRDPISGDLFFGLDVTYEITVVGGKK